MTLAVLNLLIPLSLATPLMFMKDLIDTNPAALILMLLTAASACFMGFVWLPRYLRKTKRLLRYSKFHARVRQRC